MQEIKQNSDEWHAWRQEGIGASEANIIMGKSKFMTVKQLWDLKVNGRRKDEKESNNFAADKGHRLEPKNRAMHELETGMNFPDTLAISSEYPFLRASLDGYNSKHKIAAEYKYVGEADFNQVKSGKMLDKYYPQVQQQLFVTGSLVNHFRVMTEEKDNNGKAIKEKYKYCGLNIDFDKKYVVEELLPALFKFWDSVKNKKELVLSKDDVLTIKDNDLKKTLTKYRNVKEKLKELTDLEKQLKSEIFKISLSHHNKVACGNAKISQTIGEDKLIFDHKKFESENPIGKDYFKVSKGRVTNTITFTE